MNFSGAVLAGGRSSRFGSNKAEFVWQGKTLLEWALLSFSDLEDVLVVGGNHLTARVIPDAQPFAGALYGLVTAIKAAKYPRVAIMACDMPNLTSAYWQCLAMQTADVVIPQHPNGQLEPLAAIYSRNCLVHIEAALARDSLTLSGWWQQTNLTVQVLAVTELEVMFSKQIFLNANTPKDLF